VLVGPYYYQPRVVNTFEPDALLWSDYKVAEVIRKAA
jgi:hypothetical protein